MTRAYFTMAAFAALIGCGDGNPFTENTTQEGEPDTTAGSTYFDDQAATLVVNNIAYDEANDQLIVNNIPFDDPDNRYDRITTEAFTNNFDAYESNPAAGETQYFAVFQRTNNTQVAAAGTGSYITFGYAGAGAQRLSGEPNLPTSGIYVYTGDYAAVRTTVVSGAPNPVHYITGDARVRVDYDDFDGVGAVGGQITNRILYNTAGQQIGTLNGFVTLADTDMDFETKEIKEGDTVAQDGSGNSLGGGKWSGVFAGPNGEEIGGIVFVTDDTNNTREVGALVATR